MERDDHRGLTGRPWMTPKGLATLLGVPLQTIYAWRTRGEGPPAHKIGRHLRYRPEDVEQWLGSRRAEAGAPRMAGHHAPETWKPR